jgi:LysM repeat protein
MDIPPVPALDSAALKNRHAEENLVGKKDMAGFSAAVSGKSASTSEQLKFHEIARGESLSAISIRYGMNLSALFRLNPELKGRADKVHEGMKIRIKED